MPRLLSDRTPEEREKDIRFLTALSMSELRKRQSIVNQQIRIAFKKLESGRDTEAMERALANLDASYWDLFEAVDRKSFRRQQPRMTKRARSGSIEDMKTILSGTNIKGVPMAPPRELKLMSGNSIMLDGREYKEKIATDDLRYAVERAEELSKTHDVYITYASSLYHDDSSTIYVYAAPHKTKQTKLFRAMKKRPVKPAQKNGKKKRAIKRRK